MMTDIEELIFRRVTDIYKANNERNQIRHLRGELRQFVAGKGGAVFGGHVRRHTDHTLFVVVLCQARRRRTSRVKSATRIVKGKLHRHQQSSL